MDLVGAILRLTIWQLYCVILYHINILKLRTYELSYSVVHKFLLSSQLSSLCGALYQPSKLVGLVKTAFKIILNLGISHLRVIGAYHIYT